MPQTDYLPTRQSDLANWARVFSQRISADPASFGVEPADAAVLATRVAEFRNAFAVTVRPDTRTAPAIAAKVDARKRMTDTIRAVGRVIRANPAVTAPMLVELGMIGGAPRLARHPLLQEQPILGITRHENRALVVYLRDAQTPYRRAKPVDVAGAILFTHVADEDISATPPPIERWRFCGLASRHRFRIEYSQADVGKRCWIRAAWYTRTGEIGHYSNPITATIAA